MTAHAGKTETRSAAVTSIADENIRAVARLQEHTRKRSFAARIGDRIAILAAREGTVAVHVAWFACWILANTGRIPFVKPFDPFPFPLLTTIVSLEAIFLTLFVLASQSRLTHETDRRAHLDLQVNLLSEQEMTLVLRMLGELCEHFDLRATLASPKFRELARRTDVAQLAEQIDSELPRHPDQSGASEAGSGGSNQDDGPSPRGRG